MGELVVVCSLWVGWRPLYAARNVNTLERMLKEHLKIPHRLVCMTDMPAGIHCQTLPMWKGPEVEVRPRWPNCYKRLNMFRRDISEELGDRILSIDLDCVILKDITPLITDHDFRIVNGMMAPYNGSMWLIKAGSRPQVWEQFHPVKSPPIAAARTTKGGRKYLGSDQAWISHMLPGEQVWKESDGVYLFRGSFKDKVVPKNARIVFFPGHRKPWDPIIQATQPALYAEYARYL